MSRCNLVFGVAFAAMVAVPAAALDQDRVVRLSEMPVAVARVAETETIPDAMFRELLMLLADSDLPPIEFIDIVRYLPLAVAEEPVTDDGFVEFLRLRETSGTTGDRYAQELREEMRVRGIPIDRRVVFVNVPDASAPDYFPELVVERTARRSAHPHGGPPGQLKKELGVQTGAEVVHGTRRTQPELTPRQTPAADLPPGQAKKLRPSEVVPEQGRQEMAPGQAKKDKDEGKGRNNGQAKGRQKGNDG